jgi:hypothetical protein
MVRRYRPRGIPAQHAVGLARPGASGCRASMPTRVFLFAESFSFGGSASAARSKEKYSVCQFAVFGNLGAVVKYYSTVTLLARCLGLSISHPKILATWYASNCSTTDVRIGVKSAGTSGM